MKRMIISGCIILVLASMVFVSYAKTEKISISGGNLADLKGKWIGSRTMGTEVKNTDLEILNESVPVQGKFIFYDVKRAGGQTFTNTVDFPNGKINDRGNLLFTGSNIELELSLYKDDGKMKLEGNFFWTGVRGTMSFKKK